MYNSVARELLLISVVRGVTKYKCEAGRYTVQEFDWRSFCITVQLEEFSKHWPSGPMLSISRFVHMCVCLSVCVSVCLSVCVSVCVFVHF